MYTHTHIDDKTKAHTYSLLSVKFYEFEFQFNFKVAPLICVCCRDGVLCLQHTYRHISIYVHHFTSL